MIYFNCKKEAFAFPVQNPIVTIEDDKWAEFASDTDSWDIVDGKFIDLRNTDEYLAKQAQKKRERLNNLTMTKRVLWLQLKEFGIAYQQLKDLIATNEEAQAEWDLCVDLKRDNPLLDIMGAKLNITPEQIDNMFKIANGETVEAEGVEQCQE